MIKEKRLHAHGGWQPLVICLGLFVGAIALVVFTIATHQRGPVPAWPFFVAGVMVVTAFVMIFGFQAVAPNNARALLLFGEYKGSITDSGFYWVNPFYSKKKISLRVR
ncbi:MAG: SPFH domain-containing protein, partial [Singulisphaera sp.]